MPTVVGTAWLAGRIDGVRAHDLHASLATLIASGELRPGAQLPTIRSLASELEVTTSAVATAWGMLRREGLVETRRRGGTLVLAGRTPSARRDGEVSSGLDLVDARADRDLVPDVRDALLWVTRPPRHSTKVRTITRELLAAVVARQPFPVEGFAVLPGGLAALNALITVAVRSGDDVVALESPTLMRSIPLMRRLARRVVPLELDADGPTVESIRAALADGARVVVFQPAWSVPSGATLTATRADELAAVLVEPAHDGVWLIEEHSAGPLADGATLGLRLPDRVVRITQYGRAFGPDVDLAVVGGAARVLDPLRDAQRAAGLRVSPLLQDTLAYLLQDPSTSRALDHAAATYAERHTAFASALRAFGLADDAHGGLFALIPVDDEARAVDALAASGLGVAPGSRGLVGPAETASVRVALTAIPDDAHSIGDLVGLIASALRDGVTVDGD